MKNLFWADGHFRFFILHFHSSFPSHVNDRLVIVIAGIFWRGWTALMPDGDA